MVCSESLLLQPHGENTQRVKQRRNGAVKFTLSYSGSVIGETYRKTVKEMTGISKIPIGFTHPTEASGTHDYKMKLLGFLRSDLPSFTYNRLDLKS